MNPALLSDSPTVATLNARAELRRLRILATALGINPNAEGIREEIDRLEDLLTESFTDERTGTGEDGWYSDDYVSEHFVSRKSYDDMEHERDDFDHKLDEAKERERQLEEALEETGDESKQRLAGALSECARLRAVAERMTAQRDELCKTTAAQQITQRVRGALFPLPRGAKGRAAEAFERLTAAVRKALEPTP